MSKNDEFDLRELLGDDIDAEVHVDDISNVTRDVPASQLTEVESTLKSVQCAFCECFMVGVLNGVRVCRHHQAHGEQAGQCPECARKRLMASPAYLASGHKHEQLSHPLAPETVLNPGIEGSSSILSTVKDRDIEVPELKIPEEELDREYWECFNATIQEVKDLEPERLQEIRHKHLRMIRRAKIMVQAIRQTEEGKLHLLDETRRRRIREKDTEFMARRRAEAEATGAKTSKKSESKGLSAAEKQIKQFVKLNMPDVAIIETLKAVGTGVPENVQEIIARYRK